MVNDQLLRVHQLKLLSVDRMSPKITTQPPPQAPKHDEDDETNQEQEQEEDNKQQEIPQLEDKHSTTQILNKSPPKKQAKQQATGMEKTTTPIKRHNSTSSSGSQRSAKKRSSWRYLLTPSYKSRSVEFNKLFCDTIPKSERLIADYACALHREILIQGRVYISVNYIAFYSNLFGWITKSTIRLRDVVEICKANTAKFIPNAIQIVTKDAERRVFASFVQRDKSYIMMLRIWQNNLMNERMSDQEIRNLLYFSYGNDLGISDTEEFKINSPDPVTPANVPPPPHIDDNNNSNSSHEQSFDSAADHNHLEDYNEEEEEEDEEDDVEVDDDEEEDERAHLSCVDEVSPSSLSPSAKRRHSPGQYYHSRKRNSVPFVRHKRYNSLDYQSSYDQKRVVNEVANKLNEIQFATNSVNEANDCFRDLSHSPAASSPVIVDTPAALGLRPLDRTTTPSRYPTEANELAPETGEENKRDSLGASSTETEVPSDHEPNPSTAIGEDQPLQSTDMQLQQEEADLTTSCGCAEHRGQLVADEVFDINIDTLFNLIFTNSQFMRSHMMKRGITNTTIGGWRRMSTAASGRQSSSSTLSADGHSLSGADADALSSASQSAPHLSAGCIRQQAAAAVQRKQVRQLNYSVNIDHLWAKQVQVEERQNICQAKPGVYVLKSTSENSGIPYAEAFTVDVVYCLTRAGSQNRSRMVVHGNTNFKQKQANWKLAMVKPMIERQSAQGIRDFTNDLIESIKEYISETLVSPNNTCDELQQQQLSASNRRSSDVPMKRNSLARAKSKLKERKLKNIYKYYIQANNEQHLRNTGGELDDEDIEKGVMRRNSVSLNNLPDKEDDEYISDGTTGSSSMILLDDDLDDNGSMVMMMRCTTDDQHSDEATSLVSEPEEDQHDRSFSDVNMSRRSSVRRKVFQTGAGGSSRQRAAHHQYPQSSSANQQHLNVPPMESWSIQRKHRTTKSRSRRSKLAGTAGSPISTNSRDQSRLRRYFAEFSSRLKAGFGPRAKGTLITMLVITLVAILVQNVFLLRRLDMLERRFEMKCDQFVQVRRDTGADPISRTQ